MKNFGDVPVFEPRQRHPLQRQQIKNILSRVCASRTGWDQQNGLLYKELRTDTYPTDFTERGNVVFLQVVIKISTSVDVTTDNDQNNIDVIDVFFRYRQQLKKLKVRKTVDETEKETAEERLEKTDEVSEFSPWTGTRLKNSDSAGEIRELLAEIDRSLLVEVFKHIAKEQKRERARVMPKVKKKQRRSPF